MKINLFQPLLSGFEICGEMILDWLEHDEHVKIVVSVLRDLNVNSSEVLSSLISSIFTTDISPIPAVGQLIKHFFIKIGILNVSEA